MFCFLPPIGVVPEVYTDIWRLESELEIARREQEEFRATVKAADNTLERVRKARELQRMQHKRVVQERDRVIEKMKRLKGLSAKYEHKVEKLNKQYLALLEQTHLETQKLEKSLEELDYHVPTPKPIQPKPPPSGNGPRSKTRIKLGSSKH